MISSHSDCYDADHSGTDFPQCENTIEMTASSDLKNVGQTHAIELESSTSTEMEKIDDDENKAETGSEFGSTLKLLKIHEQSLVRFPLAIEMKDNLLEEEFIDNLHKRQLERENTVKELVNANPNFLRCTHSQDDKFKCLAFVYVNNMHSHSVVHWRSQSEGDRKCAFCGGVYGSRAMLRNHLKKHHGGFSISENNAYLERMQFLAE